MSETITCEEKFDSRTRVFGESAELLYVVRGTEDDDLVLEKILETSPEDFRDMLRGHPEIEPLGGGIWIGTVAYHAASLEVTDPFTTVMNFDTSGGTHHITQSIKTVGRYPANAPNYKGAIGYDGKNVNGVDILAPALNLSETHNFPASMITTGYIANLSRKTGMYNSDPFNGFEPGEVLFAGASGTKTEDTINPIWDVTFNFMVSRNRKNFRVGDITVSLKKGWDYMWVRYDDTVDDAAGDVIKTPAAVYIEQVYESTSFASLGIQRAL